MTTPHMFGCSLLVIPVTSVLTLSRGPALITIWRGRRVTWQSHDWQNDRKHIQLHASLHILALYLCVHTVCEGHLRMCLRMFLATKPIQWYDQECHEGHLWWQSCVWLDPTLHWSKRLWNAMTPVWDSHLCTRCNLPLWRNDCCCSVAVEPLVHFEGHLYNEDTVCCPNYIELSTTPLN